MRTPENLVPGCRNQIWLLVSRKDDVIFIDTDSPVIRRAIQIIASAYTGLTPTEIVELDITPIFREHKAHEFVPPSDRKDLEKLIHAIRSKMES